MNLAIYTTDKISVSPELQAQIEQETGHQITFVVDLPTNSSNIEELIQKTVANADQHALLLHCYSERGILAALAMRTLCQYCPNTPLIILVDGGWDRKAYAFIHNLTKIY
jgi:hypothetical protein